MPTIGLEAGYSGCDDDLLDDATLLLGGSGEAIGLLAIIVQVQPVTRGQPSVPSGFVEVHKFGQQTRKRVKVGHRMASASIIVFCKFRGC